MQIINWIEFKHLAVLPTAPFYEEVFYPDEFIQLKHVYELLYPEKTFLKY